MTNLTLTNELLNIRPNENYEPTVSGRELHTYTEIINHFVSLDMAKELAMIQRTPKGKCEITRGE